MNRRLLKVSVTRVTDYEVRVPADEVDAAQERIFDYLDDETSTGDETTDVAVEVTDDE